MEGGVEEGGSMTWLFAWVDRWIVDRIITLPARLSFRRFSLLLPSSLIKHHEQKVFDD